MANSILSGNQNYKLIFEDHACSDPGHENKNHKTLLECASACDGLMFLFGKGGMNCAGESECKCLCMTGIPAVDETCQKLSTPEFDVYASIRDDQEVTSSVAPTVTTGETLPLLEVKIKCR